MNVPGSPNAVRQQPGGLNSTHVGGVGGDGVVDDDGGNAVCVVIGMGVVDDASQESCAVRHCRSAMVESWATLVECWAAMVDSSVSMAVACEEISRNG